MKWIVELRATGTLNLEIEADTEEEAIREAWSLLEGHDPEWEVGELSLQECEFCSSEGIQEISGHWVCEDRECLEELP